MLADWFFCSATHRSADTTRALLSALDALDHPALPDDVRALALLQLAEERGAAIYGYGRALRIGRGRAGVREISRAMDVLDRAVAGAVTPSTHKLLVAVRRGASSDRLLPLVRAAANDGLERGKGLGDERVPYTDLDQHASVHLALVALAEAVATDDMVAAAAVDDDHVARLVAEGCSGHRGRAALLAGHRLRALLGEQGRRVANSLWIHGRGVATLQPDLLDAVAELRYDLSKAKLGDLRREWLEWPWLGERLSERGSPEAQALLVGILGVSEPSVGLAVLLWQASLTRVAARRWPAEFARLLCPPPDGKNQKHGPWSPPSPRLPNGGVATVDVGSGRKVRANWAKSVAELAAFRGREKVTVEPGPHTPNAPQRLRLRPGWQAQAFSPWIDRVDDRVPWAPNLGRSYRPTSRPHLLRFLASGLAAVDVARAAAATDGVYELLVHTSDVVHDQGFQETEGLASGGAIVGLVDRLEAAVQALGQGLEPSAPPSALVTALAARPGPNDPTSRKAVLGSRGRQALTLWATEALGGSIDGRPSPWEEGDPPLAQRVLHEVAKSGPVHSWVPMRAAGALRVYYPAVEFERADWRVQAKVTYPNGKPKRWSGIEMHTMLSTPSLPPAEWNFTWGEPGLGGKGQALAIERVSSLLRSDAPDQQLLAKWTDDLLGRLRSVDLPTFLPRIVRRRLVSLIAQAHERGWSEPSIDEVVGEATWSLLSLGRGNPGDISSLLGLVERARGVPGRDRELLHLRANILQASALMPPDERRAKDLRYQAGREQVASELDARRAAILLYSAGDLDPHTREPVSTSALSWWRSAVLFGRRHSASRLPADQLLGRGSSPAGVLAVAPDDLGRPTVLAEGEPIHGARRSAVVAERFHDGLRTLTIRLEDGTDIELGTASAAVLERWDPDASRSFRRVEDESASWCVPVERSGRAWLPVDGGPVELMAALVAAPEERVLTLVGSAGESRWRFVLRPGESFVLPASAFADEAVAERLRDDAGGLRVTVRPELDGIRAVLHVGAPGDGDGFDDRNIRWLRGPEEDQVTLERRDGAYVWPRGIEGFPDPVVEGVWAGERPQARIQWPPVDLRSTTVSADPVEEEVPSPSGAAPDAARFEALTSIVEGTIVELGIVRFWPSSSESRATTTSGVPVLVRTESVSMGSAPPARQYTASRRAVVEQIRRGASAIIARTLPDDATGIPAGTVGVVAEAREGQTIGWFPVAQDLVAVAFKPLPVRFPPAPGDELVVEHGGLVHTSFVVRVAALWETEERARPGDRAPFLGEVEVAGKIRAIYEAPGEPKLLLCPPTDEVLGHLQRPGGADLGLVGTASVERLKGPGRWRVSLGGKVAIVGDGPSMGSEGSTGVLTDLEFGVEPVAGAAKGEVTVWRNLTPTITRRVREEDVLELRWREYVLDRIPVSGMQRGGDVVLDELYVPDGQGGWTHTVPIEADGATPFVTDAVYPPRWRVVVLPDGPDGSPVASHRAVPPRSLDEFISAEGLQPGRVHRLRAPLTFVETSRAHDGALIFERGFGDRVAVAPDQIKFEGTEADTAKGVPVFFGDRIGQVRLAGAKERRVLEVRMAQVSFAPARRLAFEASRHHVVHLLQVERVDGVPTIVAVEGIDLGAAFGDGAGLTRVERRVVASLAGIENLSELQNLRDDEAVEVLARVDVGKFHRSGGRSLVFTPVAQQVGGRNLREGDIVLVAAGKVRRTGTDAILQCRMLGGRAHAGAELGITRRQFSRRESLLPYLASLSEDVLSGRRFPVRIVIERGNMRGSLHSMPPRRSQILRDLLERSGDRYAVVDRVDRQAVVLELDLAATVRIPRRELTLEGTIAPSTVVRATLADGQIHLEAVVSGDGAFAVTNRTVFAFPLNRALNTPLSARKRGYDFTIAGLPSEFYRAVNPEAHEALVTTPHPRVAHLAAGSGPALQFGPGAGATAAYLDIDADGAVRIRPLGGTPTEARWPLMTAGEGSPAELASWARGGRWQYHERETGHRPDDRYRETRQLGWRTLSNEPIVLPAAGRARIRVHELRRHALPASELLDRGERDRPFTVQVAAVVGTSGAGAAPAGVYVELGPGRIAHLPVGLLRTSTEQGSRSLRALDLDAFGPGDRLELRIHADRPMDQAHVEVLGWRGTARSAWRGHRALLPATAGEPGSTRTGAGRWTVVVPEVLASPLVAIDRHGEAHPASWDALAAGDVVLVELGHDGELRVSGGGAPVQVESAASHPILRILRDPDKRVDLLGCVGGALPMTVESIEDGTLTCSLAAQRFGPLLDGGLGWATLLGAVGDEHLVAVGARLVLARPEDLVADIPPERRTAVLEAIRSLGEPLLARMDGKALRLGSAGRTGRTFVSLLASVRTEGFVAIDEHRTIRWLDQAELCWAKVDEAAARALVERLAGRRIEGRVTGEGLQVAGRFADLWRQLTPGTADRVEPLGVMREHGDDRWSALALLKDALVVEYSGTGERPIDGVTITAVVRSTVSHPSRVARFLPPDQRPATWDVPIHMMRWMDLRQKGHRTEVPPAIEDLRTALDPGGDPQGSLVALVEWLGGRAADLVELGEDGRPVDGLASLLALYRFGGALADATPGDDRDVLEHAYLLLAWATAWRAARSLHLEALLVAWQPRKNDPFWGRLRSVVQPPANGRELPTPKEGQAKADRVNSLGYRLLARDMDADLGASLQAFGVAIGRLDSQSDVAALQSKAPACTALVELLRTLPSPLEREAVPVEAIGAAVKQALEAWYGDPSRPWTFIPPGVDPPVEVNAMAPHVLRRAAEVLSMGLPSESAAELIESGDEREPVTGRMVD